MALPSLRWNSWFMMSWVLTHLCPYICQRALCWARLVWTSCGWLCLQFRTSLLVRYSKTLKKRKVGWRGLSLLCDVCGQRKGVIPNRVQFHGSAEFCDLGPNKIWSGNWHKCWKSQVVKCNRKVYYYMLLGCLKCRILWHHDLGSDILYM